jgi:hypothetical protein
MRDTEFKRQIFLNITSAAAALTFCLAVSALMQLCACLLK